MQHPLGLGNGWGKHCGRSKGDRYRRQIHFKESHRTQVKRKPSDNI